VEAISLLMGQLGAFENLRAIRYKALPSVTKPSLFLPKSGIFPGISQKLR
jgi:hypothetical protein